MRGARLLLELERRQRGSRLVTSRSGQNDQEPDLATYSFLAGGGDAPEHPVLFDTHEPRVRMVRSHCAFNPR